MIVVVIMILAFGLVVIYIGAKEILSNSFRFSNSYDVVDGEIIALCDKNGKIKELEKNNSATKFYPKYRFNFQGETYEKLGSIPITPRTPKISYNGRNFLVGDKTKIRIYNNDITNTEIDNKVLIIGPIMTGVVITGFGVFLAIYSLLYFLGIVE